MSKRYIIICKDRGVFVGIDGVFAFFAKGCPLKTYHAASFPSYAEAEAFATNNLNHTHEYGFMIIGIEAKGPYVNVVDIIKAGYGDYTHNMITNMPSFQPTMH
jgi:hypothetical protein